MAHLLGEEGGNGLPQWSQSRPSNRLYISRKLRRVGRELHFRKPDKASSASLWYFHLFAEILGSTTITRGKTIVFRTGRQIHLFSPSWEESLAQPTGVGGFIKVPLPNPNDRGLFYSKLHHLTYQQKFIDTPVFSCIVWG